MKTRLDQFRIRTILRISAVILGILTAAACRPTPVPSVTATPSRICSPEELIRVEGGAPHGEVIDTLTPTLTWTYPDSACRPEMYEIRIFTRWWAEFDVDVIGWSSEASFTVPAGQPLEPATHYYWMVVPISDRIDGPSTVNQFQFDTGPQCDGTGELLAPALLYPADAYHLTDNFFVVEWEDPSPCVPSGGYEVQFSTSPDFDPIVYTKRLTGTGNMAFIGFTSDDVFPYMLCTIYYWRVRAKSPGTDAEGPWSDYRSMWTDIHHVCLEAPIPGVTPHPGPIVTATPTLTAPPKTPTATLLSNANCRRGAGADYSVVTTLQQGLTTPITGRNPDSSWWQVQVPGTQTQCWVFGESVKTSGDLSGVPVVESPPLGCWVWTGNQNECKVPCPEGAQPGGACEP